MKKIGEWFVNNSMWIAFIAIVAVPLTLILRSSDKEFRKEAEPLKEFKDGIQNHLVWSLKGECYFVRPNDDVTVYLIRVNDCDKK